jgi:hypothetical protein
MNHAEDPIESVLHRAPRPQAPPGLRERLVQGIPQTRTDRLSLNSTGTTPPAWWRRWWPAVAGGSVACACLAVVGVQQEQIRTLRSEIQRLQEEAPGSSDRVAPSAGPRSTSRLTPAAAEVPMSDGPAELARLRTTVSELNAEAARLEAMRTENEQLRAQATTQAGLTPEETEALTQARGKAQRIACVNNLKQLGLAARVWETDNGDVLPPDILSMTNEMSTPKVLFCPADETRQAAADWASFSTANLSYQYLAASGSVTEPQRVMFLCPIHHNVTLCDGSVQQLTPERYASLTQRDGKFYLGEPGPTPQIDPRTGMDRRMMERYGLVPAPGAAGTGASGTAQPQVQMDPEMMKRYGLQPAAVPDQATPKEDEAP